MTKSLWAHQEKLIFVVNLVVMLIATSGSLITEASAEVTALDDLGNRLVLAAPAKRIVSLAPHLTEILYELNVENNLLATVSYSDFPEAAKSIPRVGDAFSINVERVVELQPDIIFAWETGGANKSLNKLKQMGFSIFKNEAPTLEGIAQTVQSMAALVGRAEKGIELGDYYLSELRRLQEEHSSVESPSGNGKARVFFQISDQDLYTVSDSHLIGQAINLCGGKNLFADVSIAVPLANLESVLGGKPDIVFITQAPNAPDSSWRAKWGKLLGDEVKVIPIDPNLISRPSIRMLDGIKFMCSAIKNIGGAPRN